MFEPLNKYRIGFLLYLILLAGGLVFCLSMEKTSLHLTMNGNHSAFQDVFYKTITWLGDGWVAVVISLLFIFYRFRYFMMTILSYVVSGLLAQFFKHIVFPGMKRPAAFMDVMEGLELVDGVALHHNFSFPSGHTTTAFAVLLLGGLISGKRVLVFVSIVLAWFTALSRVYLSQHFLMDVLAGSVLGVLSALFFYWYFRRLNGEWLDFSLAGTIKRRLK